MQVHSTPGGGLSIRVRPCALAAAICVVLGSSLASTVSGQTAMGTRPSSEQAVPAGFERAVLIPITGEITDVTRDSIRRRLKEVRAQGDQLIVFELNTPGGMVSSTLDICSDIKKLRSEGYTTCAWVNPVAYSGGTIIALAADEIVMAPNATMGDCQPIIPTAGGATAIPSDIRAKATSPLLAELRDSVRRNGYDMNLVRALIDPDLEIFWVENTATGERRFVTPYERDELFGLASTAHVAPADEQAEDDQPRRSKDSPPVPDRLSRTDWKYVTSIPGLLQVRQPIDGSHELLTMRAVEAEAYGFSKCTLGSVAELESHFNVTGAITRLDSNWIETIIEWLASPTVRSLLFLIMLLAAYAEFHTPGFGLAGAVAIAALVLFLAPPYLAGYTVTWEIVAIVLGVGMLLVEAFLIPGFGIIGLGGLLLVGIGLIASFVPKEIPMPDSGWLPSMPLTMTYLKHGLWSLAAGATGAVIGGFVLARYLPKMPVAGRLVLANPTRDQVIPDDPYEGQALLGHIGRTEGTLRPAGKARFGALLVDVVSDGEFIAPGTRVEVIERAGARVVVRRVD